MKIDIVEGGPAKNFEKSVEVEMDPHIKHLEKELLKVRTGRAHPSLIEHLRVEAYGSSMPLKEVAAISAPDALLLVIQPWDKGTLADIEKAIQASDLGLTPLNDGNIIRISLPKMSSTRRDDLIKVLHKRAEEARVSIRNIRKEVQNILRESEKSKKISEDHNRRLQDSLQKTTDKFIESIEKLSLKKEEEIKQV